MARELGLNPKKLGQLDNHGQEPWKAPLAEFIERLYLKRFGKRAVQTSSCRSRRGSAWTKTGRRLVSRILGRELGL